MPVITPAYPSMCATYNITRSSMTIIQRELRRGFEISEKIVTGKLPWCDLFVKHTFFTSGYKYYISVIATSKTQEHHNIWSGYVESKVRMLVQKLEQHPSIAIAHPFNKGYERRHKCKSNEEILQVQEGSMKFLVAPDSEDADTTMTQHANGNNHNEEVPLNVGEQANETPQSDTNIAKVNGEATDTMAPSMGQGEQTPSEAATPAAQDIYTTTHYIGLELASNAKSLDLSYQVDEFKALCTSWQKYQDDLKDVASIGVQHCRK
jgi:poly(A) polymerase